MGVYDIKDSVSTGKMKKCRWLHLNYGIHVSYFWSGNLSIENLLKKSLSRHDKHQISQFKLQLSKKNHEKILKLIKHLRRWLTMDKGLKVKTSKYFGIAYYNCAFWLNESPPYIAW